MTGVEATLLTVAFLAIGFGVSYGIVKYVVWSMGRKY
jgi:hypothetical protein